MPDLDAARAVEDHVAAFLLEMGQAGGGETRSDAHITWTVGGSSIDYHNAVVRLDASTLDAERLIRAWCDKLRTRHLPGVVHVSPGMRPQNLDDLLLRLAFHFAGEEPAMAVCPVWRQRPTRPPSRRRSD